MASKKKQPIREDYGAPPATLEGRSFYQMILDDEQCAFRDAIWNPDIDIVFCNSQAGTGKTTIALGTANMLYKYGLCNRIIYMVSPVQETRLGYRPGETKDKMAPYFLPLYDIADDIEINKYTDINECTDDWKDDQGGYIDCMGPMFLRGRNIKPGNILILDETQNMYIDEIKTILTRVHDGVKCIVIGHTGQCDLLKHQERSGFAPYLEHFKNQERCQVCELHNNHRGWISRHADLL